MRQKKNTPTGAATSARATAKTTDGRTVNPCINDITSGDKMQGPVEGLLPLGEQNAIRSADLADLAGFAGVRELQLQIARERANGAIILSTCRNGGGYFRPAPGATGRAEIERYVATLKSRAAHTFEALKSARLALDVLPGQAVILDEKEVSVNG